jgi:RNA polymerase sigma-70 factor (ECF subfamily)
VKAVVEYDDREAFAGLVERHKRGVFALLHRFLGNEYEVEDVAQNVFLAVYRGITAFKLEAKFSTWLYRIAYNQACSAIRRMRAKKEEMLVPYARDEEGNIADYEDKEISGPEEQAFKAQVWKAVAALPAQSRAVIELYYGRQFSYPEIAEVLSLPIGTVKTHLFRARAHLRERLTEGTPTRSKAQ